MKFYTNHSDMIKKAECHLLGWGIRIYPSDQQWILILLRCQKYAYLARPSKAQIKMRSIENHLIKMKFSIAISFFKQRITYRCLRFLYSTGVSLVQRLNAR